MPCPASPASQAMCWSKGPGGGDWEALGGACRAGPEGFALLVNSTWRHLVGFEKQRRAQWLQ